MIQRIVATLLGGLFLVAVFILTSILVAIALAAGMLIAGWVWWRSRGRVPQRPGRVIEGEYREVRDKNYHLRP
jgi:hypothetical protein